MDSLTGIMKDFVSRFFTISHFVLPEIIQVTFGFLMFSGSIKGEHWGKTSEAFQLVLAQCSSFLPPTNVRNLLLFLGEGGGGEV